MGKRNIITVSNEQAEWLTRCIGASTFIYNAKTGENEYYLSFGRKFVPITQWGCKGAEYEWIDQAYSRHLEGNGWLKKVPSTVLRNASVVWYKTMWDCLKGKSGSPKFKNKDSNRYASFLSDTFRFDLIGDSYKLFLGQTRNNIGYLPLTWKKSDFKKDNDGNILFPKTVWIKPTKSSNQFTVSYTYEDGLNVLGQEDLRIKMFDKFTEMTEKDLLSLLEGMDRGVAIPAYTTEKAHVWSEAGEVNSKKSISERKKFQRKLERQVKGSNRRKKTLKKITRSYSDETNIRKNENHHISKAIVKGMEDSGKKALIMEDLKLDNMTKSASGTIENPGSMVAQKSGLNRAILNRGLGQLGIFLQYKLQRKEMALFKVNAMNTSRECAVCEHTHADNRLSQEMFRCVHCGHDDNADHNSSVVQVKRAVKMFLDSRTELRKDGLLFIDSPKSKDGRGKTSKSRSKSETTRQKRKVRISDLEARPL